MDLTEPQKRNLLLLLGIFFGSTGLIANDLLSGGQVDRIWILFAVVCLAASIEILVRAGTNRQIVWPPEIYTRAAITVVLIGVVEVIVSLVMRVTLDLAPETAKVIVFGGALAIGVPAMTAIYIQGRKPAHQNGTEPPLL